MRKKFSDINYQEEGVRQSVIDYAKGANIKEIVALYFNHYRARNNPRINRDEAIYIVTKAVNEDSAEWKHWRDLHWAIYDYSNILSTFTTQWSVSKGTATAMMDTLEALELIKSQYEKHINAIPSREEREKAIAQCKADLRSMKNLYGASIIERVDEEARITIDISGFIRWLKGIIAGAVSDLSYAKSCITAIEAFVRKHKCPELIDNYITREIQNTKKDGARENGHPEWSKKEMDKRLKRGESVSDEERAKAIFPYYEDVKKNMKFYDYMMGNLETYHIMRQMEDGNDD